MTAFVASLHADSPVFRQYPSTANRQMHPKWLHFNSIFSSANWQRAMWYLLISVRGKRRTPPTWWAADVLPLSLSGAELVSRHCSHW